MKWLSDLATKALALVLARKVEALLGSIWLSSLSVSISLRHDLAQFVPSPTDEWAVLTTGASIAALATALFSYFWFRPKLKPLQFGVHQDAKTGAYFCSRCYLKDKKHFPLETTSNGWKCRVCGQWKEDPNNPVTPLPVKSYWNKKP